MQHELYFCGYCNKFEYNRDYEKLTSFTIQVIIHHQ